MKFVEKVAEGKCVQAHLLQASTFTLAPLPLLSVQAPASPAMTSLVSNWEVPATELVRCGGPSAALLKNDGSFEFPLGF